MTDNIDDDDIHEEPREIGVRLWRIAGKTTDGRSVDYVALAEKMEDGRWIGHLFSSLASRKKTFVGRTNSEAAIVLKCGRVAMGMAA